MCAWDAVILIASVVTIIYLTGVVATFVVIRSSIHSDLPRFGAARDRLQRTDVPELRFLLRAALLWPLLVRLWGGL